VNDPVLNILEVVLTTTSPEVAILIKIALKIPINRSGQCVATDVKLALLIQQGALTVLLDYVAAFLAIYMRIANYLPNLAQFSADSNAAASIRILTRFYDPKFFAHSWVLGQVELIFRSVVRLLEFCEGKIG